MKRVQYILGLIFALLLISNTNLLSQTLISPFKGSTDIGSYNAQYTYLTLLTTPLDDKKNPSTLKVEGQLTSNIYKRPENISAVEVFLSYKKQLELADFDIILACNTADCNTKMNVKKVYGYPNKELENRPYKKSSVNDKGYLVGWANYYISAKKKTADKTFYVMIIISDQRQLYSVDVLTLAEMEENTVTLSPELLKEKIESEGKSILRGIYFETGKSTIKEESKPALEAIAIYLKSNSNLYFYVVGHTDDTGSSEKNIQLSKDRAMSIIEALKKHGVDITKLSGHGVGSFAPITSNQTEEGRKKNRRVELVLRLKN